MVAAWLTTLLVGLATRMMAVQAACSGPCASAAVCPASLEPPLSGSFDSIALDSNVPVPSGSGSSATETVCFGCPSAGYADWQYQVVSSSVPQPDQFWEFGLLLVGSTECTGAGRCPDASAPCQTPSVAVDVRHDAVWGDAEVFANCRFQISGSHRAASGTTLLQLHGNAELILGRDSQQTTLSDIVVADLSAAFAHVRVASSALVTMERALKIHDSVLEVMPGAQLNVLVNDDNDVGRILLHGGSQAVFDQNQPLQMYFGLDTRGQGNIVLEAAVLSHGTKVASKLVQLDHLGVFDIRGSVDLGDSDVFAQRSGRTVVSSGVRWSSSSGVLHLGSDAVLVPALDVATWEFPGEVVGTGVLEASATLSNAFVFSSTDPSVIDLRDPFTDLPGSLRIGASGSFDFLPSDLLALQMHLLQSNGVLMSALHLPRSSTWANGDARVLDVLYDGATDPDAFRDEYSATVVQSSEPISGAVYQLTVPAGSRCAPIIWDDALRFRVVLIWTPSGRDCYTQDDLEDTRAFTVCVCTDNPKCCPWTQPTPRVPAGAPALMWVVVVVLVVLSFIVAGVFLRRHYFPARDAFSAEPSMSSAPRLSSVSGASLPGPEQSATTDVPDASGDGDRVRSFLSEAFVPTGAASPDRFPIKEVIDTGGLQSITSDQAPLIGIVPDRVASPQRRRKTAPSRTGERTRGDTRKGTRSPGKRSRGRLPDEQ